MFRLVYTIIQKTTTYYFGESGTAGNGCLGVKWRTLTTERDGETKLLTSESGPCVQMTLQFTPWAYLEGAAPPIEAIFALLNIA